MSQTNSINASDALALQNFKSYLEKYWLPKHRIFAIWTVRCFYIRYLPLTIPKINLSLREHHHSLSFIISYNEYFFQSQNHKITKAGKGLQDHPVQLSTYHQHFPTKSRPSVHLNIYTCLTRLISLPGNEDRVFYSYLSLKAFPHIKKVLQAPISPHSSCRRQRADESYLDHLSSKQVWR